MLPQSQREVIVVPSLSVVLVHSDLLRRVDGRIESRQVQMRQQVGQVRRQPAPPSRRQALQHTRCIAVEERPLRLLLLERRVDRVLLRDDLSERRRKVLATEASRVDPQSPRSERLAPVFREGEEGCFGTGDDGEQGAEGRDPFGAFNLILRERVVVGGGGGGREGGFEAAGRSCEGGGLPPPQRGKVRSFAAVSAVAATRVGIEELDEGRGEGAEVGRGVGGC